MKRDPNNALLNLLYRGTTTIQDFCWDNLYTVPILSLMTAEDIEYLRKLITSPRYSGNNKLKMEKIDEVMHFRGFTRFAGGTNRLVYEHPSAPNAVFKVAIDDVGIDDNPTEYKNQQFLKPYCTKVFECSPCGTIASFEKVDRITSIEEFYTIADDYFYLLSRIILGKYVLDDIGIDYFMNIGIRKGFGVVLLDFPECHELDGGKLVCQNRLDDGTICNGEIDYDAGFNKLVCSKCGRIYRARDLSLAEDNRGMLLKKKGVRKMEVFLTANGKVIKTFNTTEEREFLSKPANARKESDEPKVKVTVETVTKEIPKRKEAEVVVKTEAVESPRKVESHSSNVEIKTLNINLSNKKEEIKETYIPTLIPNLVTKEVTVNKNKSHKEPSRVTTNRRDRSNATVKSPSADAPILERIINVSIHKSDPLENVIKAESTSKASDKVTLRKIEVEVPKKESTKKELTRKTETVKEDTIPTVVNKRIIEVNIGGDSKVEEKEELPKQKAKVTISETKVEEPVVEEVKPVAEEPVVEESTENDVPTDIQDTVESVEDIVDTIEEDKPEDQEVESKDVDESVEEEKVDDVEQVKYDEPIQAVTFLDDEQSTEESESAEEESSLDDIEKVYDPIHGGAFDETIDTEENTEEVVDTESEDTVEDSVESETTDEVETEPVETEEAVDDEVTDIQDTVEEVTDEDANDIVEDTEAGDEPAEDSGDSEESTSEDENYTILKAIIIVNTLPETAEENTLYCVARTSDIDITQYSYDNPLDIDQELFKIFIYVEDQGYYEMYYDENGEWYYIEDNVTEATETLESSVETEAEVSDVEEPTEEAINTEESVEETVDAEEPVEESTKEKTEDDEDAEILARLKSQGKQSIADLINN